ncbi:histidine kinase [Streptomyces sp. RS10V-4]|uniref:sensor histidine kinase n=1 Tax=Streptomyces rhizoryzae TaxID=2932493 RepID=UPI0020040FE4|nr:histidine kinase [Streptomyces rhizoryzae]MCK7625892.1 histidine kinase [Streptomyces rhizoryzae]
MWPARRIVGETLIGVVFGLLAAGGEALGHGGAVRIVAVGLAAGVLAPLRRVVPAAVLLLTALGSVPFEGLGPLLLLAAWSAGWRISGVGRAAGVFGLVYVLTLGLGVVRELPRLTPLYAVLAGLGLLVALVVPGLAGRYGSQRRTLTDTLREYHAQLLRERAMIAGQARMRERQRIAQDMHDSLGHQLALISVHTGALEVDRELTGRQREAVGVLRAASVAAMHELREVVGVLRDGTQALGQGADTGGRAAGEVPDAAVPSRGVAGIEGLVETSRSAGAAVELRRTGEVRPLSPAGEHTAYRLVQEGLTNAHKHAPGAPITVALRYEPDSLVVEVANGPARVPADARRSVVSGGQGLTGLGERARLVGGMVHAGPAAGGGFRLAGVLPYTAPDGGVRSPVPGGAATTFVDPAGDFREQSPAGRPGEGDPVIDGIELPKELVRAMSRNTRRSGAAIGCGVVAVTGALLLAAAVVGGIFLMGEADKAMIEPAQYDAVRVGRPEAEVRRKLPDGDSVLTGDLGRGAPPVPAGATCLSLHSTEAGRSWSTLPVFRFCFKGGRLVEKKSFDVES